MFFLVTKTTTTPLFWTQRNLPLLFSISLYYFFLSTEFCFHINSSNLSGEYLEREVLIHTNPLMINSMVKSAFSKTTIDTQHFDSTKTIILVKFAHLFNYTNAQYSMLTMLTQLRWRFVELVFLPRQSALGLLNSFFVNKALHFSLPSILVVVYKMIVQQDQTDRKLLNAIYKQHKLASRRRCMSSLSFDGKCRTKQNTYKLPWYSGMGGTIRDSITLVSVPTHCAPRC